MSGTDECIKVLLKYGYKVPSEWKPTYDYPVPARHSCVHYAEHLRTCSILKRTYCKYEDCNFFDAKGDKNGKRSSKQTARF